MFRYYLFLLFISLIKSCPLKTVDSRSGCYCGIEIDGTNYIQCQPYSIEIIPEFTRSYVYDKLNLSVNFIHNLTADSFNKLKVKKIYLQRNLIESIDKQTFNNNILNYLEELHLDVLNNGSLEFLCYGTWQKTRHIELSGFNLNYYQHCFERLPRLEKVIIKNSNIKFLSYYLYQLPYLFELSLMHNHIEYLNFDNDLFTITSSIKVLNLTSNRLRTIPNDLFNRMPQLHTLDLSHNFIENLPMINYHNHLKINFSHNMINYIQLSDTTHTYDLTSNPICTLEKTEAKQNLLLKSMNQLHCDCRLAFYLNDNIINTSMIVGIQQPFDNDTICSTPLLLRGLFLKDLSYEQLLSTCSNNLPGDCREVNRFEEIQKYTKGIMKITTDTTTITTTAASTTNTTEFTVTITEKSIIQPEISSFRLTSFFTTYANNNLIIYWDFNPTFTWDHLAQIKFQIILEQESSSSSSSNTQIIRRSGFISPYLKQYTIHHIPPNKNYYVCLLLIRSSFGIDKYCRETKTATTTTVSNTILSKQAFVHMLFTNRSIVFGFLFGTILTTSLLLLLAFLCYLRSKRARYARGESSLFHYHQPLQKQKHYFYVDRNDDDGTYSNSILSSSSSSKYNHFKRSHHPKCFSTLPCDQSWYHRGLTQLPMIPPAPCCFHHHHHSLTPDTTISSSATTRRITSLSSQYSNDMDREPMTSTSIMSSTSSDDQTNQHSPGKHLYEEVEDETTMLRPNHNTNDVLL